MRRWGRHQSLCDPSCDVVSFVDTFLHCTMGLGPISFWSVPYCCCFVCSVDCTAIPASYYRNGPSTIDGKMRFFIGCWQFSAGDVTIGGSTGSEILYDYVGVK